MHQLLLFETYRDPAEATTIAEVLTEAGIPHELEDESNLLSDLAYPMDRVNAQIRLRLYGPDFPKANAVLKEYYRSQIPTASPDYMLFSFADHDLREVVYKPDEWGLFNVVLAEHILRERGVPVNEARATGEQRQRLDQMRKPEKLDWIWVFVGYLSAVAGGVLGLVIGLYLLRGKKTLPNGERVLTYEKSDRRQGLVMMIISFIVLSVIVIGVIKRDSSEVGSYWYNIGPRRWF